MSLEALKEVRIFIIIDKDTHDNLKYVRYKTDKTNSELFTEWVNDKANSLREVGINGES